MTVGELVSKLAQYPPDMKVLVACNDAHGYPFFVAPIPLRGYVGQIYDNPDHYSFNLKATEDKDIPAILLEPLGWT